MQAATSTEPFLEGRFGKYRLIEILGTGASGVVYLAHDTLLDRTVALKILGDKSTVSSTDRDRFILEGRSVAKLNHPKTVTVFEINQIDDRLYIAMEWMKGGSAQQVIDSQGPIDWREAVRWVQDACMALEAAHAAGMLHRDIKPGNLLLTEDRHAKLGDFGLVKMMGEKSPLLTALGGPMGTPSFMSPEQCQGEQLDERSDIYSLGATLYALLIGKPPFQSDTSFGVMFAHCSSPTPDPRAIDATIPDRCAEVIQRAMAKSPSDRFRDVIEMMVALDEGGNGFSPRSSRRKSRSWLYGVAGLLLTVLLVAAALPAITNFNPSPPTPAANASSTKGPLPKIRPVLTPIFKSISVYGTKQGTVSSVKFDQKGDVIIASCRRGSLFLWNSLDPAKNVQLTDPEPPSTSLYSLGYFPKRSYVVTGGDRKELVLWDLKERKVIDRAPHPHGIVRAIAVSPDGDSFSTGGDLGWNLWELNEDGKMKDQGRVTEGLAVVHSIEFSQVQRFVGSAAGNGVITLHGLMRLVPTTAWRYDGPQTAFAFSKNRCEFAFGGDNGTLYIGSTTPRIRHTKELAQWDKKPTAMEFSPIHRVLAVAQEGDDTITFFDIERKKNFRYSTGRKKPNHSISFSPDGKYLAIGNSGGDILRAAVPVDQFAPPPSLQELDYDRAANIIPDGSGLEKAGQRLKSLLKTPEPKQRP